VGAAYTCKTGLLSRTWQYRIAGEELLVSDSANTIKRRIKISEIKKLKLFRSTLTRDLDSARSNSDICVLIVSNGKSVYIRSATYVRPAGKIGEVVIDQKEHYDVFLNDLKRLVCRVNPGIPVVSGNLLASLTGWSGVALGFGFLAFAVGGFMMDELPVALGIALFSIPAGLLLIIAGQAMGKGYWPYQVRIDQHTGLTAGTDSESVDTH